MRVNRVALPIHVFSYDGGVVTSHSMVYVCYQRRNSYCITMRDRLLRKGVCTPGKMSCVILIDLPCGMSITIVI